MDPLITKLNQRISSQVAEKQPSQDIVKPQQNFAEVLDSKRGESVADQVKEIMMSDKREVKVMSAEDIKIERLDVDVEKTTDFNPKEKISEMFSLLNDDMLKMDSAIEVLADPNIKLSRTQLLSYQHFFSRASLTADLVSKAAQFGGQTINQMMNMNV